MHVWYVDAGIEDTPEPVCTHCLLSIVYFPFATLPVAIRPRWTVRSTSSIRFPVSNFVSLKFLPWSLFLRYRGLSRPMWCDDVMNPVLTVIISQPALRKAQLSLLSNGGLTMMPMMPWHGAPRWRGPPEQLSDFLAWVLYLCWLSSWILIYSQCCPNDVC